MNAVRRLSTLARTVPVLCLHMKINSCLMQGMKSSPREYSSVLVNFLNRYQGSMPIHIATAAWSKLFGHCDCHYHGITIQCRRYSCTSKDVYNIKDTVKDEVVTDSDELESMADLDKTIENLLNKASKKDVMIKSINQHKFQSQIKKLLVSGFPVSNLDILDMFPNVLFNISRFSELIRTLISFGFTQKDIIAMLTAQPSVMGYSADELVNGVKNLNSIGFTLESIVKLAAVSPAVLKMNPRKIQNRLVELRVVFKTQDVFDLVEKCPQVLTDSIESMFEKFAYVSQEMGITQRQMMHSDLFSLPLEHLHTRHMYLVRTGYFKKTVNEKQISHNPNLDIMINTTDEEFVKKFGGLSVKEYEVFKALLKKDKIISTETEDE